MDKTLELDDEFKSYLALRYSRMLERGQEDPPINPPVSILEFESRVGKLLSDLLEKYYGVACYLNVDERSTVGKNPTYEDLVDLGVKYGREFSKKPCVMTVHINGYGFLKLALEKGFPFTNYHQKFLGVYVDHSNLTIPKMNQIAVQAAAQVLWYLEKEKIGTIGMMQKRLLDKESKIFYLLQLERFKITTNDNEKDSATIRRWISKVFPKLEQSRRGRPSKKGEAAEDFSKIVTIPNVFVQNDSVTLTNYQMLHFAITCITKVLLICGWSEEQILESEIIEHYREPLEFYPEQFVSDWVKKATKENGSIFDR